MVKSTEKVSLVASEKKGKTGVLVPEKLFYEMLELLKQPRSLNPAEGNCVLHIEKRNHVLGRLLQIRRKIVMEPRKRPRTRKDLLF